MIIIAWMCIGVGALLALGGAWLFGIWCCLEYCRTEHGLVLCRTHPAPTAPLEQLCLDALAYFHCVDGSAVMLADITRYVMARNGWAGRWRVRRALSRLLARNIVTTAKMAGGGSGFRWAS